MRLFETTAELAELIKSGIPAAARRTGGHPAKRVFQAIRIAVNDELGAAEDSLTDAITLLNPGGRISVITFHSLEDRLCKTIFKEALHYLIYHRIYRLFLKEWNRFKTDYKKTNRSKRR